jgi:cytosine/adenosine deaminase-related metal-dependent hydrolase
MIQESPMDRSHKSRAYHVEFYVDIESVRHDVTVRIGDGRLLEIVRGHATDAVELGRVALIPGLVNAHTHLEFSLLPGPIPTTGRFTDWIRRVVAYRREHPDAVSQAIRTGVAESLRSGTILIGDIATTGWTQTDYLAAGFAGVVFQELLGIGDARVASQCELARSIAQTELHETSDLPHPFGSAGASPSLFQPAASSVQFGLSPHAPYSVHPDIFRTAVQAATECSRPVAMHLAETPAELELLADGTGEFRDLLTDFGIWRDGLFGGQTPLDFLKELAKLPRSLVIHGNYLDDDELTFLAEHPQMTLVYCPRTHAAFGHRGHPWRRLLELGGSVAIGTDSRASNPDLSLFAELQFLAARHPDVSHLELLKLGSRSGRAALVGDAVDSTDAADGAGNGIGMPCDFCVVEWDAGLSPDPVRNLFAAKNRVVGTMIGGDWRFTADGFSPAAASGC